MSLLMTAVLALADDPPTDIDPTTGKGAEFGKAAPVGLLVILLMCVATFFLLRSMNRNMGKVPKAFDSTVGVTDEQMPGTATPAADQLDAVADVPDPIPERSPRPPA